MLCNGLQLIVQQVPSTIVLIARNAQRRGYLVLGDLPADE